MYDFSVNGDCSLCSIGMARAVDHDLTVGPSARLEDARLLRRGFAGVCVAMGRVADELPDS